MVAAAAVFIPRAPRHTNPCGPQTRTCISSRIAHPSFHPGPLFMSIHALQQLISRLLRCVVLPTLTKNRRKRQLAFTDSTSSQEQGKKKREREGAGDKKRARGRGTPHLISRSLASMLMAPIICSVSSVVFQGFTKTAPPMDLNHRYVFMGGGGGDGGDVVTKVTTYART